MALGIKYGRKSNSENPQAVWSKVDELIGLFRKKFGATSCRELTGLDIKTAEGLKEYYRSVHDYACTERARFAVEKAIGLLR